MQSISYHTPEPATTPTELASATRHHAAAGKHFLSNWSTL